MNDKELTIYQLPEQWEERCSKDSSPTAHYVLRKCASDVVAALSEVRALEAELKAENTYRLLDYKAFESRQAVSSARIVELEAEIVRLKEEVNEGLIERHGRWQARVDALEAERDELYEALIESVKLQAHYAELLNMHDGGKRIIFRTLEDWLDRLRELRRERTE